ncbi:hypothetical protein [Frankia casuarinae]|uniref:Uncharacterized protein n=2 Tax=Frankia casuarinae (strain DSM 45818 / CECT 9043 / HFP020203 / CcI3) TaxID=106370 RepID=Q2J7T3_FRACC|nr:hypothetical protein [Frankia casuarinae]ABD12659.1 hypothetical protein Francci3_3302 [Frankia casuarinae]
MARSWMTDLAGPRLKVARLHPSGLLLDFPFAPPPGSAVYVATFWPEPAAPSGWSFAQWQRGPHHRGVQLPQIADLGDVVGFRAVTRPQLGNVPPPAVRSGVPQPPPAANVVEWWGYLHAVERGALVLHGPHPSLPAAYAAAQHALAAQVWAGEPAGTTPRGGPAGSLGVHPSRERAWREPAQPPAAVSLTWHGDTATVSDPRFGWLHVPADDLAAALTRRSDELVRALQPLIRGIDGTEPPVTLAALAALHLPDLPNIHAPTPPPGPSTPEPPAPEPSTPEPPASTGPDLDGPS